MVIASKTASSLSASCMSRVLVAFAMFTLYAFLQHGRNHHEDDQQHQHHIHHGGYVDVRDSPKRCVFSWPFTSSPATPA